MSVTLEKLTASGRLIMTVGLKRFCCEVGHDKYNGQYWGQARDALNLKLIVPFTERFDTPEEAWNDLIRQLYQLRGK
jgi:hypothetical protein